MDRELAKIAAKSLGEDPIMTMWIINFYEKTIADTIEEGRLQNIRVPLFGIFRVNLKKLRYVTEKKPSPKVITSKNEDK